MNLFGIKKKSGPSSSNSQTAVGRTNVTETISLIRNNLDMLDKREQHIYLKIGQSLKEAREKASKKDKK
jgi:hypothetical protein